MALRLCARVCARTCVCHVVWLSHGFTFHPNFIGASGLLSALIELTSEEQSLFEESAGILRRHHLAVGAFNGVYIRISQHFRKKRGFSFRKVYNLVTVGQERLWDADLLEKDWWVKTETTLKRIFTTLCITGFLHLFFFSSTSSQHGRDPPRRQANSVTRFSPRDKRVVRFQHLASVWQNVGQIRPCHPGGLYVCSYRLKQA